MNIVSGSAQKINETYDFRPRIVIRELLFNLYKGSCIFFSTWSQQQKLDERI